MDSTHRILIVANRTSATPRLLAALRTCARARPCEFELLIPAKAGDDWTPDTAIRLIRREVGPRVRELSAAPAGFADVRRAIVDGGFDEVYVSTRPSRAAKLLHRDLVRRLERLGTPVTAIVPGGGKLSRDEELEIVGHAGLM